MDNIETQDVIANLSARLNTLMEHHKTNTLDGTAPNGKYYRSFNQREATEMSGINHKKINDVCDRLGIKYKDGNKWVINHLDLIKLRAYKGYTPYKRPNKSPASVWVISILKGGTGKTTVAVTLASGLSQQLLEQYKVLLIDLDPQSTSTHYYYPLFDDSGISICELMMQSKFDPEQESFEDHCLRAVNKTNIKTLDILCSRDSDRRYDLYVKQKELEANSKSAEYCSYTELQKITEIMSKHYDIILIDTPPHFSAANLAAHYVANNLLIPIRPSENDWDSGVKYFSFLNDMYSILSGLGHKGYENIKVLLSAQKSTSRPQEHIAHKLRIGLGYDYLMANVLPESEAILTCAEMNSTTFDISESEYMGTKKTLKKAQDDALKVVHEFEGFVRSKFDSYDK
ncbi:ParA family protein [uncultured Cetobacterium sp.]|uniref:ParA family protein n=1 Tax=uncultured Cetobacterium sp. TaxID=527638 RepID=UPI002624B326|nr:ParA family protein [uncultured Cetobacterium sp.]